MSSGAAATIPLAAESDDELADTSVEETEEVSESPQAGARDNIKPQPVDEPRLEMNDWRFEEELQAVDRLLRSLRASGVISGSTDQIENRFDLPDPPHEELHGHTAGRTNLSRRNLASPSSRPEKRSPVYGFVAWSMLSLGLMTFVCGGVLLGWSFADGREQLWTYGLPLTLGGQALLLVGLLFQLEKLWLSNRQTSTVLDELDEQLDELRHTTGLLSTSRSGPAQSFYAHMAEGASPELLLADLKGQLDMLTMKMANQRR